MSAARTPSGLTSNNPAWDPEQYDRAFGFVARLGAGVLALLAPQAGERVLDLGCGTGHLAGAIAAHGCEVIGLDADEQMLATARAHYPHVRFEVADAHSFVLDAPVDAVFSNAALHWMTRPAELIASVFRSLRPGGRFVAEMGGAGNIGVLVAALRRALAEAGVPHAEQPQPWYFPTPNEYRALLEAHGLHVRFMRLFPRMTPLDPGDGALRQWLSQFAAAFLDCVPAEGRDAILDTVEAQTRAALWRGGRWHVDYHRLRFMAVKSA